MFQPTGKPGELRAYLGGKTKVAIVGFCNTNRELAPYEDDTVTCWGLNRGYIFQPRAEVWFDMHGPHIVGYEGRRPGKHREWLAAFPGPVYMHVADPEIPNSLAYPLMAVAEMIGGHLDRVDDKGVITSMVTAPYLSSSIAFEIALAIYEGYEEIGLYGIDLQTDSEYAWQKPGVEYLVGLAQGRGIRVILPTNCPLCKGTLYGRGYLSAKGEIMGLDQLETRRKALDKELGEITKQLSELQGAKRELEFVMEQLVPGLDHERLDDRHRRMDRAINELQQKLLQVQGGIKETAYWIHQTPSGQDPAEAIAQLRSNGNGHVDGEGPITELALMQTPEAPLPEKVAVGV